MDEEDLSVPSYICSHAALTVSMVQMEPRLAGLPGSVGVAAIEHAAVRVRLDIGDPLNLVHFCNREARASR